MVIGCTPTWSGGLIGSAFAWGSSEAFRGTKTTASRIPSAWRRSVRIPGGCLDLPAGGGGHRARVRRPVPQRPCVADPERLGLDAAETSAPRLATRRGSHRAMAHGSMARTQKKARRERRTVVFTDESGFYLLPGVVTTYGPRGQTPVLREWQSRDHLSLVSGITPEGKLYSRVQDRPVNGSDTVGFLNHLLTRADNRLLVIWDGSPIHRAHEVREFLLGGKGWVHLERLPPYAPELNPDEGVWQHLKKVELRNLCCHDLTQLHGELTLAISRLRQKPNIIQSFFAHAKLAI
jgi:transposase